jgi:hypothetical protein
MQWGAYRHVHQKFLAGKERSDCKRGQTALLMLLDTAVWEYNLTTHNELASPTHAVFNIAVKGNDRGILSLLLLPKRTFPTTSALRTGTK